MTAQIYDPKMKEVTVVSDDDVPLVRKRKRSTSDTADGGKKKKTEGGASKKSTYTLEVEKRRFTGMPFTKEPPLCKFLIFRHCPSLILFLYLYFCMFQEE